QGKQSSWRLPVREFRTPAAMESSGLAFESSSCTVAQASPSNATGVPRDAFYAVTFRCHGRLASTELAAAANGQCRRQSTCGQDWPIEAGTLIAKAASCDFAQARTAL